MAGHGIRPHAEKRILRRTVRLWNGSPGSTPGMFVKIQ